MEKLGKLGRRKDGPGSPSTTPGGAGPEAPTVRDPDAPSSSHDGVGSMSGDGQDYDIYLANGQGVVYRDDRMSIGNDPETLRVRDNPRPSSVSGDLRVPQRHVLTGDLVVAGEAAQFEPEQPAAQA